MIKQRVITAAILIPVTLALLYFLPPLAFFFLTGFITLYAAWEWTTLLQLRLIKQRVAYVLLISLAMSLAAFIAPQLLLFVALLWWCLAAMLVMQYPRASHYWGKSRILRGMMGMLVLIPCWIAIIAVRMGEDGFCALVYLFVLIWGADSVAYFAGRRFGKHKLAPKVSPGKSWEGVLGALIAAVFITIAALYLCRIPYAMLLSGILLALFTVIFSVLGDLFESMLKRNANLKDSGSILPGHGGLLDRIDSLTAAAPIFALGAWLIHQLSQSQF